MCMLYLNIIDLYGVRWNSHTQDNCKHTTHTMLHETRQRNIGLRYSILLEHSRIEITVIGFRIPCVLDNCGSVKGIILQIHWWKL